MTKTTSGEPVFETTEDEYDDAGDVAEAFGLSEIQVKRTVIRGKPYQHGKPQDVPETLRRYIEETDKV